jgi:hypothetical protein
MLSRKGRHLYQTKHHFVLGLILAGIVAVCTAGYLIQTEKDTVRVAAVVFFVICGSYSLRLAFAGIRANDEDIYVKNMLSGYRLKWNDIHKFRIGPWNIFPYVCLIDLKNGRTKHAFGIQERSNFPNGSAERMAEELNARLAQRSGTTMERQSQIPRQGPELG